MLSIDLPISAMDIRKVQKVIREIYEGGDIQVKIVDDIDNLLNIEKVLAIGNVNRINYEYKNTGEMMADYFKIIDEENSQLLSLIDKHKIQSEQFFPIFAFSNINNQLLTSEKLKEQKINKLDKVLKSIANPCRKEHTSIEHIMEDMEISPTNKNYAIIYSMLIGSLSPESVADYLINLFR